MTSNARTLPMPATPEARPPAPAFSVADMQAMAEAVAKSRLFPGVDTPQAAFCLMMLCQAEGLHPMQAMKRYHIVEGRPSMRADAMLAEFQARGGQVRWRQYDDAACEATFAHPRFCPEGITIRMTLEEMRAKSLTRGKDGEKKNWRTFPGAMLRARVTSAGIRMVDPGLIAGIYTPEEVADFTPTIDVEATPAAIEPPKKPLHPERYPSDKAPPPPSFDDFLGHAVDEWCEFDPIDADDDEDAVARQWRTRTLRLVNRIVSDAIEDDLIAEESILKPAAAGQDPKRDPRKAWDAARWLYETQTDTVRLIVSNALDRKRAEAATPPAEGNGDDRMSANPEAA